MLIVPAKPFDIFNLKEKLYDKDYKGVGHSIFFTLGRYALLYTLEQFGICPLDNIICPAYYCNSALEPIISRDYNVTFIDITTELNIDTNTLIREIERKNCKAVILPNYFGLFDTSSETIYEECKKRGVIVIKDFAHSYLSYLFDSKNQFCDAIILSMRKSVNIHYGGVAIFINKSVRRSALLKKSFILKNKFKLFNWVESLLLQGGINIYGETFTHIKNLIRKGKEKNININAINYEVIGLEAIYLLNRNQYSLEVASIRRMNYEKLLNLLKTSSIHYPLVSIRENVPQIFPIFGDINLCTYLRNNGVGATMWPFTDLPKKIKNEIDLYPNTEYFLKSLICLPIHQGLSEKHINKMSELIHEYRESN